MIGTLPAWKWRSEAPCSATRRKKESNRAISAPGRLGGRPRALRRGFHCGPGRMWRALGLRGTDGRRSGRGRLLEQRLEVLLADRLHVGVLGGDPALLVEAHQVLIHELHALLARGSDHGRDLERLALADEVRHRLVVEHHLHGQHAPLPVPGLEQVLADHRAEAVGERGPHLLLLPRRERADQRSEEHTSELQSLTNLVCRLLLEKQKAHVRTPVTDQFRMPYSLCKRQHAPFVTGYAFKAEAQDHLPDVMGMVSSRTMFITLIVQ